MDVNAMGGSVRDLLGAKWAQRGQLCTMAEEKLNPRLEPEKRNPDRAKLHPHKAPALSSGEEDLKTGRI